MKITKTLVLTVLLWLVASTALAQQLRFDPQFFHPNPMQRSNPTGMWSADVIPDGSFEVGLLGHYDLNPLVVRGGTGDRLYSIVGDQGSLHIIGGIGLFDLLEIGADIPIILHQSGDVIPTIPNFDVDASGAGAGAGDVRLTAKVQFFTTHTEASPGGAAIAFIVEGLFPSGDRSLYQGDDWRVAGRFAIDGVTEDRHRFSLNLGATYRQDVEFAAAGLSVGPTFDFGMAMQIRTEYVHVVPEVRGSLVLTASDLGLEEVPVEAGLAIRVLPIEQLQIQVSGGAGLFQGFGAPVFRFIAGASWLQTPSGDRDGDGIPNDPDECPDDPEDFDEFEDENGCPDPDNDQDGILDDPDECPMQPEDRDGFEDTDGCPDPDNDQDGILDEPDECPDEPEDIDQFEDRNGCPDPDNDQDGILDEPDQCPNEPEDMNGIDDLDGCPEVDTDGDGLLDPVDQCPTEPEDFDQFEDENGCPDPDNDQDGILDAPDRCPNEPEVVNGFEDEDGCPDESVITVTCNAIEIRDSIYFETNSDVIRSRSHPLLTQIAAVLGARPDILRISVEGHTDDRGSDSHNLDLSTRRAASVRTYLGAAGIDASRLASQGFGEARPIETNRSRAGRAANRRVEFVILEQEGCQEGDAAANPAVP